jgi:hypothetical protein
MELTLEGCISHHLSCQLAIDSLESRNRVAIFVWMLMLL